LKKEVIVWYAEDNFAPNPDIVLVFHGSLLPNMIFCRPIYIVCHWAYVHVSSLCVVSLPLWFFKTLSMVFPYCFHLNEMCNNFVEKCYYCTKHHFTLYYMHHNQKQCLQQLLMFIFSFFFSPVIYTVHRLILLWICHKCRWCWSKMRHQHQLFSLWLCLGGTIMKLKYGKMVKNK